MGKFDTLKQTLSKTAEKAKETAKDATGKLKDIDFKEVASKTEDTLKSTAQNLQSSIQNFDAATAKESVTNMAKNGVDALKQHFKNAKETDEKVKAVLKENALARDKVMTEDALKIVYLLMLADKTVSKEENERFDSIVKELDTENECNKQEIIDECNALIATSGNYDFMEYISDGVQDALHHSKEIGKGTINKKLLLWNLLAVAYSDGDYSEGEKSVLRIINRRMEIDPSIILEMETAVSTLDALLKQEE